MKKIKQTILGLGCLILYPLCWTPLAFPFETGILGGLNVSSAQQNSVLSGLSSSTHTDWSWGMFYQQELSYSVHLESGLYSLNRGFYLSQALSGNVAIAHISAQSLFLPTTLDASFLDQLLEFGLGGYFAVIIAPISQSISLQNTASESESYSTSQVPIKQAGISTTDFGLTAHIRYQHPLSKANPLNPRLIADLRYNFGLQNISTNFGQNAYFRDLVLMVGAGLEL